MNKSVRFLSLFITLATLLMISGCSKSNMQSASEKPIEATVTEDDGVYIGNIRRLSGEFDETKAKFAFYKDGLIYLISQEK